MKSKIFLCLSFLLGFIIILNAQDSTYAEKLGFPKGAKVIILHVDDVGMSFDSNEGAINAMTKGVATSCSIMMPCAWVPGYFHYLKQNPNTDAGLHLTLTSEWKDYRWGPLSGKSNVPGLVDGEGALWPSVAEVVKNASADEVDKEIRAQIGRAKAMGFDPTHLDSHMGTLFASAQFLDKYLRAGMEYKIPVMFPGGHATLIKPQIAMLGLQTEFVKTIGKKLWDAGLPVLDDLFNDSYGWNLPSGQQPTDDNLRKFKTAKYIDALKACKPGVTMVIMHCTQTSEIFKQISDSGPTRRGDLLAMMNPELKDYIKKEGIILTTWRELMERRQKVK